MTMAVSCPFVFCCCDDTTNVIAGSTKKGHGTGRFMLAPVIGALVLASVCALLQSMPLYARESNPSVLCLSKRHMIQQFVANCRINVVCDD